MSDVFDLGMLDELIEEAQKQSDAMSSYTQFGKMSYGPATFKKFVDGAVVEVTREEYMDLPTRGKVAEITVRVDVQEFNPDLTFGYERRVGMNSADWFKHWRKSVEDVFGLHAQVEDLKGKEKTAKLNKLFADAMRSLDGKYVEVVDVPQEARKNAAPTDKTYRTPELVRVFESREECVAAMTERFGKPPAAVESVKSVTEDAPEGFSSYGEFTALVKELAESGRSNAEIAKDLGVTVTEVVKARR